MTRMEMMDKMIQVKGLENETTIMFCKLAENQNISKEILNIAYNAIIKKKVNKKLHELNS